jgi:hypothetical protein
MTVIDHGFWVKYIPSKEELPFGIPRGAAFIRRESDGQDWYEYVNRGVEDAHAHYRDQAHPFEPDSVKCVIEIKSSRAEEARTPIIRAAAVDATRLHPQDCQLIELTDMKRPQDEEALITEFANRKIDLKTGKVGEEWQPPPPPKPPIDDRVADALEMILQRLEKLEGK